MDKACALSFSDLRKIERTTQDSGLKSQQGGEYILCLCHSDYPPQKVFCHVSLQCTCSPAFPEIIVQRLCFPRWLGEKADCAFKLRSTPHLFFLIFLPYHFVIVVFFLFLFVFLFLVLPLLLLYREKRITKPQYIEFTPHPARTWAPTPASLPALLHYTPFPRGYK